MEAHSTLYVHTRTSWRNWLEAHFRSHEEIWLIYPKKASGKARILYNDAVEEALCFGWIDSINKTLDPQHTIQRFSPRKPGSSYSQANKERLRWLVKAHKIHPSLTDKVEQVLGEAYIFPEDIITQLQADKVVWEHYQAFSDTYKRIRIAYIDSARKRPEAFKKRLLNFINNTRKNKLIRGYGGIDKYY